MGKTDSLDALRARELDESARLAATAENAGSTALSKSTIAAAVAIIKAVAPDRGRGALGEPTADLRDIRRDPRLAASLQEDLRIAEKQAFMLIRDALIIGYRTEGEGTKLDSAHVVVTLNEQDRRDLSEYPILGFTPLEHAQDLTWKLRLDVLGALGQPVTGQVDPTKIASAMGECAAAHGKRLGGAVTEAYFAGVQAAGIALGRALVGQ